MNTIQLMYPEDCAVSGADEAWQRQHQHQQRQQRGGTFCALAPEQPAEVVKARTRPWSEYEQDQLTRLVQLHGHKKCCWAIIAEG